MIKKELLPFPTEEQLPEQYLKDNFWKCLYKSTHEQMLHYWVILPNRVKPTKLDPVALEGLSLINIGQYATIDSVPYIEVWLAYENYPYEMNCSDWLRRKLMQTGEEIIHEREITSNVNTGRYLDALCYKKYENGNEVISRYTVIKDYNPISGGANYFLLKASCFLSEYKKLCDQLFHIVANWNLLNRTQWPLAELFKTVTTKTITNTPISFYIPNSWQIKEANDNRLIISHNIDNENTGVINVLFFEVKTYPTKELAYSAGAARMETETIHIEVADFKPVDILNDKIDLLFTRTGVLKAELPEKEITGIFDVYLFRFADYWGYFELVGPLKNKMDSYWEVNQRCIEIILNSFNKVD